MHATVVREHDNRDDRGGTWAHLVTAPVRDAALPLVG